MDKEKAKVLNNFCAFVFTGNLSSHTSQVDRPQDRDWGSKVHPTIREAQVCDHLRNLNIHNSMGHEEVHPRLLRESADVVAKHSPSYFTIHGTQVKSVTKDKS